MTDESRKPPVVTTLPTSTKATSQKPVMAATKESKLPKWLRFRPTSKKEWIIGLVIIAALLAGGFFGGSYIYKKYKDKPTVSEVVSDAKPVEPPKPTTEASRLTGVQISPELNLRPVIGIMIENSPDARPQAGLKDAGIVFEAIAEGGITRFLALFQEAQPDYIGPVRSVRPYYLDWLTPFDGAIVHAGGSAQGLSDINTLGVKDLNHNSTAFKRVSTRFAPHNLYTGFPALDEYAKSKGYTASTFTSWPRKDEKPATTQTANSIDMQISSFNYNTHYDWDAGTNTYKRTIAGKPHIDEKSGAQLAPKVVIAMVVSRGQSGIYSVYQTVGSGTIFVFQDGLVAQGTWSKSGRKDQYVFKNLAGDPLTLNPGQTWVSVIAADNAVSYKP